MEEEVKKDEQKVIPIVAANEEPQRVPRAGLSITIFNDGTMQINGPLDDALMYHGLLGLAVEARIIHSIREQEKAQREDHARRAASPNKSPGLVKRFLDTVSGRNKKAAEDRLAIARKAREEADALKAKREAAAAEALALQAAECARRDKEQEQSSGTGDQPTKH